MEEPQRLIEATGGAWLFIPPTNHPPPPISPTRLPARCSTISMVGAWRQRGGGVHVGKWLFLSWIGARTFFKVVARHVAAAVNKM